MESAYEIMILQKSSCTFCAIFTALTIKTPLNVWCFHLPFIYRKIASFLEYILIWVQIPSNFLKFNLKLAGPKAIILPSFNLSRTFIVRHFMSILTVFGVNNMQKSSFVRKLKNAKWGSQVWPQKWCGEPRSNKCISSATFDKEFF